MHQRRIIRDAVIKVLKAATAAGDKVVAFRSQSWRRGDLPAISVSTPQEQGDLDDQRDRAPAEDVRRLALILRGHIERSADDEVIDRLDDFAEEIEAAINAGRGRLGEPHLGGTCRRCDYIGTTLDFDTGGEYPTASIEIVYQVEYQTDGAAVPDACLDVFKRAAVAWDLNGTTAAGNQAHDTIELEQPS